MNNKIELIQAYFKNVKTASKEATKKEAFKDLLNRLYATDSDIIKIIDKITLGAEHTILNIPRKDKLHSGSADTLYNKILIEFENDLKKTLEHAKEQLAGYLLGQCKSGEGYNFTLIASDCISWKVFSPDFNQIKNINDLREDQIILKEIVSASFILTESNSEDFFFWIDRYLFKEQNQRATLNRIKESFGYQSIVFIESFRELTKQFISSKYLNDVQVSFEQWKKFLSIAYGSFDASESNFLIHTYLSIFSKMLAYSVISNDDYLDEDELKRIINGEIFYKYNIQNFTDNDFFHWIVSDENFWKLKKVFRLIAQEISTYDFTNVDEDILKGVYQELIDLDTRHTLGEYYTPDWLCERIVKEFDFKATDKILDPACGSGSFLRAAIHRFKKCIPGIEVEALIDNIYGIDIHPLSVQIAKTTLLLSLGKDIIKSKNPIYLNIILANTLLAPEGVKNLWGNQFSIPIDKEKYILNTQVFEDVKLFDNSLNVCEELAEQTINKKIALKDDFTNILVNQNKNISLNQQIIDSFYEIYKGFKIVKEKDRDSIWKFIIQNLYKPYFLNNQFNYVLGNPPWFTYNSIKNEEYQDILDKLATTYKVKPSKVADYPHLEIAAIFLAYCNNYFLKEGGELAFVLPHSFFSGSQHDNTRSGKVKGFRLTNIWDLTYVSPLFRIPSCVLFSEKAHVLRSLPIKGLQGLTFEGDLPAHNCNYDIAKSKISETIVTWYYVKLGKATAYSLRKQKKQIAINPYKSMFKQGATIVPRTFYFVELAQENPPDFEGRIINLKTSQVVKFDAKPPWKNISISGKIESKFIFRTAIGKNILPFYIYKPELVVLPLTIENDKIDGKIIKLHTANDLMKAGYLNASKWFTSTEKIWNKLKTKKSVDMSSFDRLDFQKGITDQNLNAPFLVIYNGRGTDASACVVKRSELDLEFFIDHANYWIGFTNYEEAHYVSAILNSSAPNLLMKDFQSTGLYGARNIHKKILDIFFPKFDINEKCHNRLSELSKIAHLKAIQYLTENPPEIDLSAIHLGRIRVALKNRLLEELTSIDALVQKII